MDSWTTVIWWCPDSTMSLVLRMYYCCHKQLELHGELKNTIILRHSGLQCTCKITLLSFCSPLVVSRMCYKMWQNSSGKDMVYKAANLHPNIPIKSLNCLWNPTITSRIPELSRAPKLPQLPRVTLSPLLQYSSSSRLYSTLGYIALRCTELNVLRRCPIRYSQESFHLVAMEIGSRGAFCYCSAQSGLASAPGGAGWSPWDRACLLESSLVNHWDQHMSMFVFFRISFRSDMTSFYSFPWTC